MHGEAACRTADTEHRKWLDENQIAYELRDIKTENPTYEELAARANKEDDGSNRCRLHNVVTVETETDCSGNGYYIFYSFMVSTLLFHCPSAFGNLKAVVRARATIFFACCWT